MTLIVKMDVGEIIVSQKGKEKMCVRGYLMIKERNREDIFYWCCEKRKQTNCKGRVTTIFVNGQHHIRKFVDHNHSPEASSSKVAKIIGQIKTKAIETREAPCQIIQTVQAHPDNINIHPYMPSKNAIRQIIQRRRHAERLPEPEFIEDINIPENLKTTLNGNLFLIKDSFVGEGKILIFSTNANIHNLAKAPYWIMDGTFKTVPHIFQQLYTIHAPVGNENSRVLPLVYALMTHKNEIFYRRLFQDLNDFAEEIGVRLNPSKILTDMEMAAINASRQEFPEVVNKICFFHFGQCGWRKIQASGLASRYGNDEEFNLWLRHLFALAFLPADDIPAAYEILKPHLPLDAEPVIEWFENNYLLGRVRRQINGIPIRGAPLFPAPLWSVFDSVELGIPRTQNIVEAWHRRWNNLIARTHVGLFAIITEFQKEQQQVEIQIECILRGEQRPKRKRKDVDRENRILMVMNDRQNRNTMDYLRGIAHSVSL